jgi:tripartite-type tricarboxylate transporter receptor subunit TctC
VLYKSTPQMLQDTSAGVTQLMISSVGAVQGLVTAGKLRMIALSSKRRLPGLDHVHTIAETLPGFCIDGWFAGRRSARRRRRALQVHVWWI